MPRHTPMDSDPSPIDNDSLTTVLRPEIIHHHTNARSTSIMRWLLFAASLGVLFFV